MKKSLLIVALLAVVAGTTGLLIGLMIARARHGASSKSAAATGSVSPGSTDKDIETAPSGEPR